MTGTVTPALIKTERDGLRTMLLLLALAREVEALTTDDARLMASVRAIRRIERTLDMVSNETVAKLASVNELSGGLLSELIAARVSEIGGALPLYANARGFFLPLVEQVDAIRRQRGGRASGGR
jgi:hypothetical protein